MFSICLLDKFHLYYSGSDSCLLTIMSFTLTISHYYHSDKNPFYIEMVLIFCKIPNRNVLKYKLGVSASLPN